MVFSSLIFLFSFLPIVLFGNWIFKSKRIWQNSFLLIASLFFYAWGEGEKIILMIVSILINYIVGRIIGKNLNKPKAKTALIVGVVLNLGILLYYKYMGFFVENINVLLDLFEISAIEFKPETLPIGISFYTFQALSYIIDVYRKETPYQKNPFNLGLYIALFPQLIAGPIVRYNDIDQELIKRDETTDKLAEGTRRFLIGLSKKVLLANNLGVIVDQIFDLPPDTVETPVLWVGMIAYSLQLYFDFSGYSDMAIGLGRMFGFTFPENFNFPYTAQSIQDFWRRWHITLSVWFRDYLYIPLGGNRVNNTRTYINLFIVFLATGMWHGASWNFIIWGLLHGFFIIIERLGFNKILEKAPAIFRTAYTLFVVMFAWVLFRAEDLTYGLDYIFHLIKPSNSAIYSFDEMVSTFALLVILTSSILATPLFFNIKLKIDKTVAGKILSDTLLILFFIVCISELISSTYNPFIYFRF